MSPEEVLDSLGHRPGFRLMLRQDAPLDVERLLATLESLRNQVYRDWRLADTGKPMPTPARACAR